MKSIVFDPTRQSDILKDVLGLIEDIRTKRHEMWRGRRHPEGKRFTQDEIRFGPCPTYHNLITGRSQRLPARQTLLDIADYLECTIAETNEILIAAEYLPQYTALSEQQYQKAIDRAKLFMQLLPLPALVYGHQQEIVAAKDSLLAMNHLPPLEQWYPYQRNPAHWFFDRDLPAHQFYTASWEDTARGIVEFIYLMGKPYLRERSFAHQLEEWSTLPDFVTYWEQISSSSYDVHPSDEYGLMLMQTPFLDIPIEKRNLLIPMTQNYEVVLGVGIPQDEAARYVYKQAGCPIDDIRWEDTLKDLTP